MVMSVMTPWLFPEFSPVGVDLGSLEAVANYDRDQGTDAAKDRALLDRLGVDANTRLVDLACGTGSFLVEAAGRGAEAHGVDVSEQMLAFTRRRAEDAGVEVSLHHAGFLTYQHVRPPADVVTTLLRITEFLQPGGLLYIWDVIFTFPPADYAQHLQALVDEFGHTDGTGFSREDFESHIREEFSTYSWILEGLLDRAGFDVISTNFPRPTHGEFCCRRR